MAKAAEETIRDDSFEIDFAPNLDDSESEGIGSGWRQIQFIA
jgi:hypothetical protein